MSVGVCAVTYFPSNQVTYDNKTSGLKSIDVQGAIDELYNECSSSMAVTGGSGLLDKVDIVTSGDGLYEDEYENGRYIYRGADPNNYVLFNNQVWRIVSIENDGTIKIVNTMPYPENGNWIWGGSNTTDWSSSSIMERFNSTEFKNAVKFDLSKIDNHTWGIGTITYNNNDLADQINDENSKTWVGQIAFISVTDFIRANSDVNNCGTFYLIDQNRVRCNSTNWMVTAFYEDGYKLGVWTISWIERNDGLQYVGYIQHLNPGSIGLTYVTRKSAHYHVALYLNSSVKFSGTGTSTDPYRVID